MVRKKEQLKIWKEINKVKYVRESLTFGRHRLTKNKVYEVYGIYLQKFSDKSEGLYYLIKEDNGGLNDCPIKWFEIVEVKPNK